MSTGFARTAAAIIRVAVVLPLLILPSCVKSAKEEYRLPEFKKEIERDFEIVGESLPYNAIFEILPYNNSVILLAYDVKTGTEIHLYDKATATLQKDAIHYGRGPGEVLSSYNLKVSGNSLYLNDRMRRCTAKYNLEKLFAGEPDAFEGEVLSSPQAISILTQGDSTGIAISQSSFLKNSQDSDTPRIEKLGGDKSEYREYPLEDRMMTWYIYMPPKVTMSPDGKHLAIAPTFGAIMEFFDVRKSIKLLSCKYYIPPGIKPNEKSYDFSDKTSYGFTGLTSTNDRVYAGMIDPDIPYREVEKKKLPLFPMLVCFDWSGKELTRIRTNYNIRCLCVDEDESKFYAVVSDSSGVNYLARMSLD